MPDNINNSLERDDLSMLLHDKNICSMCKQIKKINNKKRKYEDTDFIFSKCFIITKI